MNVRGYRRHEPGTQTDYLNPDRRATLFAKANSAKVAAWPFDIRLCC